MATIFLIVNPRGRTGKTTICKEFLIPRLGDYCSNVVHVTYGCDDSHSYCDNVIQLQPFGKFGMDNTLDIQTQMLNKLFGLGDTNAAVNDDGAAIIEIGTGFYFRHFINDYFFSIAELFCPDGVQVLIPINVYHGFENCIENILSVKSALNALSHMHLNRIKIKLIYIPACNESEFVFINDKKEIIEHLKKGTTEIYCGEIPYINGLNRGLWLNTSWREILMNPRWYLSEIITDAIEKNPDKRRAVKQFISQYSSLGFNYEDVGKINSSADLLIL